MAKIARPEIEIEELTGEGSGNIKEKCLAVRQRAGRTLQNVYRSCYAQKAVILLFMYMKENQKPIIF